MKPDIVRRYAHNPILTKADIPYPVETVHNAAVVKHEGEYIMLFRSHLRTGRSIIGLARSPEFSGSHRIPAAVTCTKPLQRVHALSRLSEHAKLLAAPQLLSVALFFGYTIVYPTATLSTWQRRTRGFESGWNVPSGTSSSELAEPKINRPPRSFESSCEPMWPEMRRLIVRYPPAGRAGR